MDFDGYWCIVSTGWNCTRSNDLAGCGVKKLEGTKRSRWKDKMKDRHQVEVRVTTSEKGAEPVRKLARIYLDEQNEENENVGE